MKRNMIYKITMIFFVFAIISLVSGSGMQRETTDISIFLQNVTDLCDLNDTVCTSLQDKDLLSWDTSLQRWLNKDPINFRWLADNIYLYNDSSTIYFNEAKLNQTIDLRDTQKNTTGFYLYNDSTTIYFNETQLNNTIGEISITEEKLIFENNSEQIFIKSGYPNYLNISDSFFVNGTNGYVGIGTATPNARLHVMDGILQQIKSEPRIVGSVKDISILNGIKTAFVFGKYAYVTAFGSDSLAIIDTSDPQNPRIVGNVTNTTYMNGAFSVFVFGNYAYAASRLSNSLTVIDISNPSSPEIIGSVINTTYLSQANSVYVSGKYAYVASFGNNALTIVDVSDKSNPEIIGSVSNSTAIGGANGVIIAGRYAYVSGASSDSLAIVDVSNPFSPSIVSYVTNSTAMDGALGLEISNNYVYVTGAVSSTLAVVDVSNPSSPSVSGYVKDVSKLSSAQSVDVSGRYAYVPSASSNSVSVIDILDPTNPQIVSSIISPLNLSSASNLVLAGRYAYVSCTGSGTFTILDILGAELTSLDAGNVRTNSLDVYNYALFGNGLQVRNGIAGDNLMIEGEGYFGRGVNIIGDVGIGTTSPSVNLEVVGNVSLNNSLFVGNYELYNLTPSEVSGSLFQGINTFEGSSNAQSNWVSSQIILRDSTDTDNLFTIGFDNVKDVGVLQVGMVGVGWYDLILNPRGGKVGIGVGQTGDATAFLDVPASTTATPSMRIRSGTAPTSPNSGDIWADTQGLKFVDYFNTTKYLSPETIIYVHTLDDFPTPDVNGYIHLESRRYVISKALTMNGSLGFKGFYIDHDASPELDGIGSINYISQNPATDALFKSDDFGDGVLQLRNIRIVSDGSGRFWKINSTDPDGFVVLHTVVIGGFYDIGTIEDISYFGFIVNLAQNVLGGLKLIDNKDIVLQTHRFYNWFNAGATFVDINGTIGSIQINNNFFQPQSNENSLYLNPSLTTSGGSVTGNVFELAQGGGIFQSGSKDQTDIYWTYAGNSNLADSTSFVNSFSGVNVETTVITTQSVPVVVSATLTDDSERFQIQNLINYDTQTQDFTVGDILTGGTSGTIGIIIADNDTGTTGTLKVISMNSSYTIAETITGNTTGSASYVSGSARLVYLGLEDISVIALLRTELKPTTGVAAKLNAYVYKNGVFVEGSKTSAEISGLSGSEEYINGDAKVDLVTNDYLEGWVSNEDSAVDILVTDLTLKAFKL